MINHTNVLLDAPVWFVEQVQELQMLSERPDYHPEPNAFVHECIVAHRCAFTNNINLVLTAWLHDSFKLILNRTNPKTGFPTAPGHDKAAADLVRQDQEIQQWILRWQGDVQCVAWLCEQHMRIAQLPDMRITKQKQFRQHQWFALLESFHQADNMVVPFPFIL